MVRRLVLCVIHSLIDLILTGVGLSCVYVPAVVIVAHYFDENRAIATAVAVGGTGLFLFLEERTLFFF